MFILFESQHIIASLLVNGCDTNVMTTSPNHWRLKCVASCWYSSQLALLGHHLQMLTTLYHRPTLDIYAYPFSWTSASLNIWDEMAMSLRIFLPSYIATLDKLHVSRHLLCPVPRQTAFGVFRSSDLVIFQLVQLNRCIHRCSEILYPCAHYYFFAENTSYSSHRANK